MTLNEVFHLINCTLIYIYADNGFHMFNMNDPLGWKDGEDYLSYYGSREVRDFHYYGSGDTIPTFHIFLKEEVRDHEA